MIIELETFRLLLSKKVDFIFTSDEIINSIDPKGIFIKPWTPGVPVLEVYSDYNSKDLIAITKRIKDLYKLTVDLSFEAPSNNNPQDFIISVAWAYSKKLFLIMCTITFENPETLKELPRDWVKGISEVNRDKKNFPDVMEKLLMPTLRSLANKPILDRYTRKDDRKEIDKFIQDHKDFFSQAIPRDILRSEECIVGWFKELRNNKVGEKWVERYLKSIEIPSYTADDLRLIIICAGIKSEEDLSFYETKEEVFDLFWDNIDTIYERLFHENITNTPIFIARLYVSMFFM